MPDDYILVYDADSRPDLKSIDELSRIIQTKRPNVIQQSSLYIGNYDVSSPYMKVEALFESIRAMGLERRNYLLKKAEKAWDFSVLLLCRSWNVFQSRFFEADRFVPGTK